MKTSTRCVQLGRANDVHGAFVPPIYQTATFEQPTATEFGDYDYTRSGNPTRSVLEQQLANLEDAKYACAFASGMAALTALTRMDPSARSTVTSAAFVSRNNASPQLNEAFVTSRATAG